MFKAVYIRRVKCMQVFDRCPVLSCARNIQWQCTHPNSVLWTSSRSQDVSTSNINNTIINLACAQEREKKTNQYDLTNHKLANTNLRSKTHNRTLSDINVTPATYVSIARHDVNLYARCSKWGHERAFMDTYHLSGYIECVLPRLGWGNGV